MTNEVDRAELEVIASSPISDVIVVDDFDLLADSLNTILETACIEVPPAPTCMYLVLLLFGIKCWTKFSLICI